MSCLTPPSVFAQHDCDGVTLALNADVSGNWIVRYSFNGVWMRRAFAVTAGVALVLPAGVFMEEHTYVLELYRPDGSLFGQYQISGNSTFCADATVSGNPGGFYVVSAASGHVARIALGISRSVTVDAIYSDSSGAGATTQFTAHTDATGDVVNAEMLGSAIGSSMADFTLSFSGNAVILTPTLISGNPATGTLRATISQS